MNLRFDTSLASGYTSKSQISRVLTENWLVNNMYCPICGEMQIHSAEANAPVKDCICFQCKAQYELKSKETMSSTFEAKVADGVYTTMIQRITSLDNPSFFFLHYNRYEVKNLIIVPRCFFTPSIIEKRNPLPETARRHGWEGCNILLSQVPKTAKISVINDGVIRNSVDVVKEYNKVYSLQTNSLESRGWLLDVLKCVDRLNDNFSLKEMYGFTDELQLKHPQNNFIQDKIRQQLQYLRDKGFIEFKNRGYYQKIK